MNLRPNWKLLTQGACLCVALLGLPAQAETGRVIVKYRETSTIQALSTNLDRKTALSVQMGVTIADTHEIGFGMHAVRADGVSSTDLILKLMGRADVEFVEEDKLNQPFFSPNDPFFSSQWYLQSTETAAIRATTAWDTTTGSSSVTVAVLDTGILADHPDLQANTNILTGYDFITNTEISNDGDGRDASSLDPGDWLTSTDIVASTLFTDNNCPTSNSSWHGSIVTGIIGAATNNSTGIAGIAPGVKVLPVRVLGKCGGYASDIIAGMSWAAGVNITGFTDSSVPANANPAKILNMSLGFSGSCPTYYQTAITSLKAAGVLVVAATGNDDAAVGSPANCTGAFAVSAVSHTGAKASYSNFSSRVDLSAPGGGTCAMSIISTRDTGTQGPVSRFYSDATNCEAGTSFAAPMVSGVAALMLSVNSSLTPDQLSSLLKSSATAFPTTVSGVTTSCVGKATTIPGTECLCTTATCGAGMLNAAAAVTAAKNYVAPVSSSSSSGSGGGGGGGGAIDVVDVMLLLGLGALAYAARREARRS